MKNRITLLFLLVGLVQLSNALQTKERIFDETDAYLEEIIDSLQIVGLNYAILIDNEIVHIKSFGLANTQLKVQMTIDNSFPVASISKLFSSIALYKLLHIHNRSVDETVGELLPNRKDLPESWRKLTLKQLLSHTSGIPDQIDYQIYLAPDNKKFVIDALRDKSFSSKPGTRTKYNATGFLLIRIILEKLAKQDFESYMQEQYFDTLSLSSAKYGGFKKVIPNRVTCYQNVNGELEMFPLNYSSPMYAGAGLNITIGDLTKWIQAVLNEQIMNKEELSVIWDPVILNNGEPGFFGLGWETYELKNSIWMTGHGGAGISSVRHYWKVGSTDTVTVILLTNGARNWSKTPDDINMTIANYFMQGIIN
ncbi:MAG: serine hydrolase domain-containing protein [Arenibacter algicola]